jgi:ferredoxin
MKVEVDAERCMGHGQCYAMVPEVFQVNPDTGFNEMGRFEAPDSAAPGIRRGMSACPERAISILDGES